MRKSDLPEGHFSSQMLTNGLVFRQFSRVKCNAFRGESSNSGRGMASFGRGIYSTTNRFRAKEYGVVRRVEIEELPFKPLRFKDTLWYQQWEYDLNQKYGRAWVTANGYAEGIIRKLGFDGVTVGTGRDMIICKYTDVR